MGKSITKWWKKKFPQSNISLVNAGIGATDSLYGALRVQEDLLKYKPDFVVVEYSVNDQNIKMCAETLEGIIRQTLNSPNNPAVMLLFTMNLVGDNAQKWHSQVGKHYDIPMISYRDAVWPEVEAGKITWRDISPDEVHPNGQGYIRLEQNLFGALLPLLEAGPLAVDPLDLLPELGGVHVEQVWHVAEFRCPPGVGHGREILAEPRLCIPRLRGVEQLEFGRDGVEQVFKLIRRHRSDPLVELPLDRLNLCRSVDRLGCQPATKLCDGLLPPRTMQQVRPASQFTCGIVGHEQRTEQLFRAIEKHL